MIRKLEDEVSIFKVIILRNLTGCLLFIIKFAFILKVEGRNLAIAQASKALNWCKTLVGFSDSTEYIECERILLIESKKNVAQ